MHCVSFGSTTESSLAVDNGSVKCALFRRRRRPRDPAEKPEKPENSENQPPRNPPPPIGGRLRTVIVRT